MSATYFWYQDKVVVLDCHLYAEAFQQASMHKFRYCPCLDAFEDLQSMRYGYWGVDDAASSWPAEWVSTSFDYFPAEFKASLLLLGVS